MKRQYTLAKANLEPYRVRIMIDGLSACRANESNFTNIQFVERMSLELGLAWKSLNERRIIASLRESFQFQEYHHPPRDPSALDRCGIEMF